MEAEVEVVVTAEVGGEEEMGLLEELVELVELEEMEEMEEMDLLVELVLAEVGGEEETDLLEVLVELVELEVLEELEELDLQGRTGTVRGTDRTVAVTSRERGGMDWVEIIERHQHFMYIIWEI